MMWKISFYSILLLSALLGIMSCGPDKLGTEGHNPRNPENLHPEKVSGKKLHKYRFKNVLAPDPSFQSLIQDGETVQFEAISHVIDLEDRRSSLFKIPLTEGMLTSYVLFEMKGNTVGPMVRVKGAWIDNEEHGFAPEMRLLKAPLIFLKDINQDGNKELVLKDRQHIGNVYDAAVEHYFKFAGHQIRHLGSFETIGHLPVDDQFLVRHWDFNNGEVAVFKKPSLESPDSVQVGKFEMELEGDTLLTKSVIPIDEDFADLLIATK